jgi:hypothetical protein
MNTKKVSEDQAHAPGAGLDIGTMNIVSARRRGADGQSETKKIRDAFLDLDLDAKRSLKMSGVNYVEREGTLIVIGDSALTMANLFKREARRPLSKGVIAAGEIDAQEILSLLTHHVLSDPVEPGEHCFFSVPSVPLDDPEQDILYHTEVFRKIVGEHGYTAHPANEAMAIIYSQCAKENFSGLAVSFGAGMCNIALAYQAAQGMEFSLARGGDWVDAQSARAVGRTAAQMCAIKEQGVNLAKPKGREQEAIVLYVRALIDYCLQNVVAQFRKVQNEVGLPSAVPFIVSGGSSMAEGFLEVFKQQFQVIKKGGFPIEISEVRGATNPMTAVAEGLLVLAVEEHEEE